MFRRYLKNIPKEFGKVFEALADKFAELNPEEILKLRDWTGGEIPDDFIPYLAWENGCLYDYLFFGHLTPENIKNLRELRAKEGTTDGLVEAVQLVPAIVDNSVRFEREDADPACTGKLTAEIDLNKVWTVKDWKYFFYLISDYKRASLWLTMLLSRSLQKKDLFVGAGVIADAVVTFPVQPAVTGGHPLYIGAGIIADRETVFPVQVITQ